MLVNRSAYVPPETLLHVLKFLAYPDLCNAQQATRQLNGLIEQNQHKLALCKFNFIEILPDYKVNLASWRRSLDIAEEFEALYNEDALSSDIYHVDLTTEQAEKWENALQQHVPVYSYPERPESILHLPDESPPDSFIIFLSKEVDDQRRLSLELPFYPASMDDLHFTRFWLRQLSRVHFAQSGSRRAFFNPDMLKILFSDFPLAGDNQIHFHSSLASFKVGGLDELYNTRAIDFALNHMVTKCLIFRVWTYYEAILDFLLGGGTNIQQVLFPRGPGSNATVELHNLLIFHAESSEDSHKMVACIEFNNVDDFQWPAMRTAKQVEQRADEEMDLTRYRMASLCHPGTEFTIEIGHLTEANEFKRFKIQRIGR